MFIVILNSCGHIKNAVLMQTVKRVGHYVCIEECEHENDEDGCVVVVSGELVDHASPTQLLMPVEESL